MKVNNKVIVVSGAGNGIGRALVLKLLQKGARIGAVDINEAALGETAELVSEYGEKISTHVLDVSDHDGVKALPEAVIKAHSKVDAVINNAGIIQPFVPLVDLAYDDIDRVINWNLYGTIYMTKAFLPYLLERPEAHIVNISSMGGFFPFPKQTLYGASKAAVKLLTEGLYAELIGTRIHVTVVFPGAIATNIAQNSGVVMPNDLNAESSGNVPMTSPEKAAKTIINGMERDKFQVYIGMDSMMMNLLYKLMPRQATRLMQRMMAGVLEN